MLLTGLVFVSDQLSTRSLALLLRGTGDSLLRLVVEQQLPGNIALIEMVQLIQYGGVLEHKLQDRQFDEAIELKRNNVSCLAWSNRPEYLFDARIEILLVGICHEYGETITNKPIRKQHEKHLDR